MRRRLGPPLFGIGSAFVLLAILTAGESGLVVALAGMFVALAVAWRVGVWVSNRRPVAPSAWHPPQPSAFRVAAPHPASSPRQVAVALNWAEARELTVSAPFGVGLGFCVLMLILFGLVWGPDWGGNLPRAMELYPIYTHPFVGMIVLGSHRARTRSRRDDLEELFDACPTSRGTRTVGHLLTAWLPAVVVATFLMLLTVISISSFPYRYGEMGARQVALVVGSAILGVGGTALGVALARWTPWALAPVVALITIAFASVHLATRGANTAEPLRQLSTWLGDSPVDLRYTAPAWLAHHVWVASLVILMVLLALARDHWSPRLVTVAVIVTAAAVGSAVLATRPMELDEAERIAVLINDPAGAQECVAAEKLPVCVFPGDAGLARHLAQVIRPVADAAPPGSLDGWVVRYGHDLDLRELDPAVRALVRPRRTSERIIPMQVVAHPAADEGARFWTALAATRIAGDSRTALGGQSRGVIALWLATRGTDEATALAMTSHHPNADPGNPARHRPWPDSCWADPAPVTWALSDLTAARQLQAAPEDDVRRRLWAEWDRFVDPATTTDELMAALGLPPVGSPSGRTPPGQDCY